VKIPAWPSQQNGHLLAMEQTYQGFFIDEMTDGTVWTLLLESSLLGQTTRPTALPDLQNGLGYPCCRLDASWVSHPSTAPYLFSRIPSLPLSIVPLSVGEVAYEHRDFIHHSSYPTMDDHHAQSPDTDAFELNAVTGSSPRDKPAVSPHRTLPHGR
jgi:hypothetical protein